MRFWPLFLSTVMLFSAAGPRSSAQAREVLWPTPDGSEPIDIDQSFDNVVAVMVNGSAVGQSFVPAMDHLYRLELLMQNRADVDVATIKLWSWVDANDNGVADNAEYATTTANTPLWQDDFRMPGSDIRLVRAFFPGSM